MRPVWVLVLAAMAVGCGGKMLYLPGPGAPFTWSQAQGKAQLANAPEPPLRLLWQQSLSAGPLGGPLVDGLLLLQTTAGPTLLAFDRQNGRPLGRRGLSAPQSAAPVVLGSLIAVGEAGPKPALRAYDRGQNRVRWSYPGLACAPLAGRADTVVAALNAGEVVALAARTGERLWHTKLDGPLWVGPVLAGDALYGGDGAAGLVALELDSGTRRWTRDLGGPLRALATADSAVYAATASGSVLACRAATGEVLWRAELGSLPAAGVALAGGVLVLGAADRNVYGLDLLSGERRWQYTTEGVVRSAPAATASTVYVGSSEGHLYALAAGTGRLVWKYQLDGPVLLPVALGAELVAVTTEERTLYVFGR